jgi:hypothetical protein
MRRNAIILFAFFLSLSSRITRTLLVSICTQIDIKRECGGAEQGASEQPCLACLQTDWEHRSFSANSASAIASSAPPRQNLLLIPYECVCICGAKMPLPLYKRPHDPTLIFAPSQKLRLSKRLRLVVWSYLLPFPWDFILSKEED